jgi:hypothetical protein
MHNDGSQLRTTVEPIRDSSDTPDLKQAPDWNEKDADNSGAVFGIARRDVQGATTPNLKGVGVKVEDPADMGSRMNDARWAHNGMYAAKERSGEGGHGTMQIVQSLEPTIRDGAPLGGTIHLANAPDAVLSRDISPTPENEGQYAAQQQFAIANAFAGVNSSLSGVWG